jgi:hypothetical protein
MGVLQNVRPSFLEGLGQKMKQGFEKGLEIFGKAKGLGNRKNYVQRRTGNHAIH